MSAELQWNGDTIKALIRKAGPNAAYTIGLAIEGEAKTLAPVDTGRLRDSIATQRDGESAVVGPNVEYAPFVEYGTRFTRAQPFLRPAIDTVRGRAPQIAADVFRREFRI